MYLIEILLSLFLAKKGLKRLTYERGWES